MRYVMAAVLAGVLAGPAMAETPLGDAELDKVAAGVGSQITLPYRDLSGTYIPRPAPLPYRDLSGTDLPIPVLR